MIELRQTTITKILSSEEKIKLCHSRIPKMRSIIGFLDSGLIAPLPIWSPIPKQYRRTSQDSFHKWGLEAQDPKYLLEDLKPFVRVGKRGRTVFLYLLPGAHKQRLSQP